MSKKERVLKVIQRRWLTSLAAVDLCHCLSLSQRCGELKREGHNVVSRKVKGKPYHEYRVL